MYKKENGDGFELRGFSDGSYLRYPYVKGMQEQDKLILRGSCEQTPCRIEVREDGPDGALLGSCEVQPELAIQHGGTREFAIPLTNTHGTHSLCFVFSGEGEDLFIFDDFRFEWAPD